MYGRRAAAMRLLIHRSGDRLPQARPPEKVPVKPKGRLPQLRHTAIAVPRKPLAKPKVHLPVRPNNLPPAKQRERQLAPKGLPSAKQRERQLARPKVRSPLLLLTATAASSSKSVECGDGRRHMITRILQNSGAFGTAALLRIGQ